MFQRIFVTLLDFSLILGPTPARSAGLSSAAAASVQPSSISLLAQSALRLISRLMKRSNRLASRNSGSSA